MIELINAYENLAQSSEQLIKLQKERIAELEQEVTIHKEAVERLIVLLEETIAIAKNQIDKILPTPTLN
jgi:cell division septum initiation protein DivIVA